MGKIFSINISKKTGEIKTAVKSVRVDKNGIIGDAHAGDWHRQVSLLSKESIDEFNQKHNLTTNAGDFAENLTVSGIDFKNVKLLDRFVAGKVILEVTQIGKECHNQGCAIKKQTGACIMPKEGLFTRVIHGGEIAVDDAIVHQPREWKILLITLSDRAYRDVYDDRSGPLAKEIISEFFSTGSDLSPILINNILLPDDPKQLETALLAAVKDKVDVIFTLGGTGIGPRDNTPEVVEKICDKLIPGVMEFIRMKYGALKPNALLSRSIAGVVKQTQIYALPGSTRAVKEYLVEILPLLEHAIYMLNNIDAH